MLVCKHGVLSVVHFCAQHHLPNLPRSCLSASCCLFALHSQYCRLFVWSCKRFQARVSYSRSKSLPVYACKSVMLVRAASILAKLAGMCTGKSNTLASYSYSHKLLLCAGKSSTGGPSKDPFLLACRFFDRECAGYIEADDLEEIAFMVSDGISRECCLLSSLP